MNSSKKIMMVTALTGMLFGCGEAPVAEKAEVIRPAKLIDVQLSSDIKRFSLPAVVEASNSKDMTFQVSGQVEKLNVREGQEVKEGDIIATMVQRNFSNQLQTAQTQFDAAKLDFERAERLIVENAIAQTVFDQRKTQLDVTTAALDTAKKAIEDTVLRAPFNGVVAVEHVEELDTVTPSQPIYTLQSDGPAEALVKLPASLVTRAKQIEPIESVVILDTASDIEIDAKFVTISTLADEQSQTFDVRFSFTSPENLTILPGMTGVVRLALTLNNGKESQTDKISIPLNAVVSDGNGQYVWKVDTQTMTVSKHKIEVGTGVGETLTVESGINDGDTIVGAGASYLTEGMKIRRLEQ